MRLQLQVRLLSVCLSTLVAAPLAVAGPLASGGEGDDVAPELDWNRRTVEHLLNRAGFGARGGQISRALKRSPEEVVDELLEGGRRVPPPHASQGTVADMEVDRSLPREKRRRASALQKREDRYQMEAYTCWWIDRMLAHDDPLRDRMTLFWHGLFATQYGMVKRSYDMIQQHQLIRENAIESYATLLHGIAKDPAMVLFLDNQRNKKKAPNENLARELMELFSLGEGNYTEKDVKEVARALTGTSRDKVGNYRFDAKHHDNGRKTILGETGRYGADEVVDLLLRQTACARYVTRRIITYLEGVPPDELRLVEYAAFLQRHDYELKPFLRKLLLDPRFYREEVLEARVLGPVDYVVGSARRLGMKISPDYVRAASAELGQKLFDPPSVKGWDQGVAWINTGSLLARGNSVGLMLGTVDLEDTFRPKGKKRSALDEPMDGPDDERVEEEERRSRPSDDDVMGGGHDEGYGDEDSMGGSMMGRMDEEEELDDRDPMPKELRRLVNALGSDYQPELNLCWSLSRGGIQGDERIVAALLDDLLAIEAPKDTRQRMLDYFRAAREAAGLDEQGFLEDPDRAEPLLRQLAHLILALPEAQLG